MKRTVFLFGAGAAIPWGGPFTNDLTNAIRRSGFSLCDSKQKITDYIYECISRSGLPADQINFETIISVIEELIIYFSSFTKNGYTSSLFRTFFDLKDIDKLLNFSLPNGNGHGFKLDIPKGIPYDFAESNVNNETPEQAFFQHLLKELLTDINAAVAEYSYHTVTHSSIFGEANATLTKNFVDFIKTKANSGPVRLYTLNYDRNFKVFLERDKIPIFEGFESGEAVDYGVELLPDLRRITTDFESNIHYNLHGCNYWRVLPEDERQLYNHKIVMAGFENLSINDVSAVTQIERGRSLVVSNIITGYQKAQKAFLAPFRQMQSAFDRDCLHADILYIIGYSFGDEHVNSTIKVATRYNPNLKIVIVDPSYSEVDKTGNGYGRLTDIFFKIFFEWFEFISSKNMSENEFEYFSGKLLVSTLKFEDFLLSVANKTAKIK